MTADDARGLAMGMPEAAEQDHHGFPSFRVRGRIFATLPDEAHLNVMVDEQQTQVATHCDPSWCAEILWGGQIRGVRVTLAAADPETVTELIGDAWRRRAPASLRKECE